MCGQQFSGEEDKSTPFCPIDFFPYLHDLSKLNDAIWLFVTKQSERYHPDTYVDSQKLFT